MLSVEPHKHHSAQKQAREGQQQLGRLGNARDASQSAGVGNGNAVQFGGAGDEGPQFVTRGEGKNQLARSVLGEFPQGG